MGRRTLIATFGLVALAGAGLAASAAGAEGGGPERVSVNIVGGDHFPHPGLLTNDMRFPDDPIVVAQGGTITLHNKTIDAHTVALVNGADLPRTAAQVFNCPLCDAINNVLGIGQNSNGPHAGVQLDNGKLTDDDAQVDADAVDAAAIASAKTPVPPGLKVLVADFDTASHGSTVGDATLMDTADPTNGHRAPTQRTIRVTAAPGLYHFYCTIHPWMQGTIRVVKGDN
jgi:plastocyanin